MLSNENPLVANGFHMWRSMSYMSKYLTFRKQIKFELDYFVSSLDQSVLRRTSINENMVQCHRSNMISLANAYANASSMIISFLHQT